MSATKRQIREVLCYNADERTVALLIDGDGAGCEVVQFETAWEMFAEPDDTRGRFFDDLHCMALTRISDGEITYKPC